MKETLFCEKCGKILDIVRSRGKIFGLCGCGFASEVKGVEFSEKIPKKEEIGEGVISEEDDSQGFPHICKKCGHDLCEFVDLGIHYGDESDIYLYKCKKCKHVERQADGSGNK